MDDCRTIVDEKGWLIVVMNSIGLRIVHFLVSFSRSSGTAETVIAKADA